jgi:nitrate reductase NapAB chaperone NapD
MGFLTHVLEARSAAVESALGAMPELSTYGVHQGNYVVAVAEAPYREMDALLARVRGLDGVLAVYMTSCDFQDELEA